MNGVEASVPGQRVDRAVDARITKAKQQLKDAEVVELQSDAWLRQVARRVSSGEFSIADCEYLRGIMGSERFEQGSVAFLDTVLRTSEEILERGGLDPEQFEITSLGIATARVHLRALGKRLAGLQLMLKGPKPLETTPPQKIRPQPMPEA